MACSVELIKPVPKVQELVQSVVKSPSQLRYQIVYKIVLLTALLYLAGIYLLSNAPDTPGDREEVEVAEAGGGAVLDSGITLPAYSNQLSRPSIVEQQPMSVIGASSSAQSSPQGEQASGEMKKNLMFVKTHKCGTSTLVNVFYLRGARRRLNFVMHPYRHQLTLNRRRRKVSSHKDFASSYGSTKNLLKRSLFEAQYRPLLQPRPGGVYNMQCQHGTFVPAVEHELMPKDTTLYTTIVRSPVSHFKSAFAFFGAQHKMAKELGEEAPLDDLVNLYLDNINDTTTAKLSRELNSVAKDLGYGAFTYRLNGTLQDKIDAFIAHLDTEMDYVMITDRMDESLVVLKELLGWNMTDILYLKRMVSDKKQESFSEATQHRVLEYQMIDRQIFEHFNTLFQQQIDDIGREKVATMVKEFTELRETFENKCFDKSKVIRGPYRSVTWAITDYGKTKNMACTFLQTRDVMLTKVITQLQLSQDYTVPIERTINGPYLMQHIVEQLQRDYDNNEDPV